MGKAGVHLTGDWKQLDTTLKKAPGDITRARRGLLQSEAKFLEGKLRWGIIKQAPGGKRFKPLAQSTIAARRAAGITGNKALIATGELLKGISARKSGRGWFVGFQDQNLSRIARLQEEGFGPVVRKMTPKMRRYLFGVVFKNSPGTGRPGARRGFVTITVPARPFFRPTVAKYYSKRIALARLTPKYAKYFHGRMGKSR